MENFKTYKVDFNLIDIRRVSLNSHQCTRFDKIHVMMFKEFALNTNSRIFWNFSDICAISLFSLFWFSTVSCVFCFDFVTTNDVILFLVVHSSRITQPQRLKPANYNRYFFVWQQIWQNKLIDWIKTKPPVSVRFCKRDIKQGGKHGANFKLWKLE